MPLSRLEETGPAKQVIEAPASEYMRDLLAALPENNIHKEKQKPFTPPNKLTHGLDKLYRNPSLGDGAGAERFHRP